jgi:hypothetical protein
VIKSLFAFVARHERSLSAASMIGGFAFDNYAFRRIDLPNTQLVFLGYLTLAAVSMLILHVLAERVAHGRQWPRWQALLPMATQFALGGLWSAFLVFYSRSAVLATSWPFLLVLTGIFIGNEIFKKYHSRLAFTAVLFFFALTSYATVTVPLYTHTIGMITFLLSGAIAVVILILFLRIVADLGPEQWRGARLQVIVGAGLVYALINIFYFTGILPPLPIALASGGVYHFVAKAGPVYKAQAEPQSWWTRFGAIPVEHLAPGQPLYVYSAVFAPIKLATTVQHRWQHYDTKAKTWRSASVVAFKIVGGRDNGYRGYTVSHKVTPGDWRVDVDLPDGHIIGRVRFSVTEVPNPVPTQAVTLK